MSGIVQDPITGAQDNRRVNAFLRGPIVAGQASPRFALAVEAEVRNGVLHQAVLDALPSPRDALTSNFGVQSAGGFDAAIYATELLPGTYSADGHWDGYSLVSLYGESPISFTRNLPIPVPDWEGWYRWTRADEFAPAAGCRRVENEIPVNTEDLTASGWSAGNLTSGAGSSFSGLYSTKRFTLSGGNVSHYLERNNVLPANTTRWVSIAVDLTGLTTKFCCIELFGAATPSFTWTGAQAISVANNSAIDAVVEILGDYKAVIYAKVAAGAAARNVTLFVGAYGNYNGDGQYVEATRVMVQPCDGESVSLPGEYVSRGILTAWPYHGFGVDGVVWKRGPVNATRVGNVITRSGSGNDLVRQAHLYLPGRTGNNASTPNAAANQITGDIDIRARGPMDFVGGSFQPLAQKFGAAGQYSWQFLSAVGFLRFVFSLNGTVLFGYDATASMGGLQFDREVRVTRESATGNINFYLRRIDLSVTAWTPIGATVAGPSGALFNSNADVVFGDGISGRMLSGQIYNGINGALAVDLDPARIGGVMSTGEAFTVNTSGAGNVARIVEAFTDATQKPYYHTPQEANLFPIDLNSWGPAGAGAPTIAAATGPDSLLSAWTLTDSDAAGFRGLALSPAVANDSLTRSLVVAVEKDSDTTRFPNISLGYSGGTPVSQSLYLNTATGATVVTGPGSATVDGNTLPDWWFVRLSLANNSSGNTAINAFLYPAAATIIGTASAAATGSTTFAWPMAVLGARAEVYNPPGAATRNVPFLQMPTSIINDAEGFVYAEFEAQDWATAFSKNAFGRVLGKNGPAPIQLLSGQLAAAYDGINVANSPVVAPSGKVRAATAWSGNKMTMFGNGVAGVEANYVGTWGGAAVYVGVQNNAAGEPFPCGSIGPIKWGKKRPSSTYLAACNAARDLFSRGDFDTIRDNSKGTKWELELLSQMERRSNGVVIGTLEVTDVRRAVVKRINVNKNRLSLSFADIDTDALDRVYPANKYTKEEWTNIYEGHIGRVVPDLSPGTHLKVPGAFINTNGTTTWTISFCEKRTGPTYTGNTVYRDGRIVSASEYTVSTATAVSGLIVLTVVFAREQRDISGRQYEFTADISVSGSREPSREIDRLLTKVGIATDAASVTAAIAEDAARAFYIDAAYTVEVQLKVIIEYLLQVARCDLYKSGTGAWALIQDKVRASVATLRERDSLIDIDSVEEPMPPRAYELKYRPRLPGGQDWQFTAVRTGTGSAETMLIKNPYIYDGAVADRLIDYIAKRENGRRDAKLKVWGAMFDNGDVLTVDGVSCYSGTRDWLIRGVERPTDANGLTARQYDAAIYTYTAGTVPAGATSAYAPDYSQTNPAAPTALTYTSGSSGTTISLDGVGRAYMFYSVTPPAVNAARIVFEAIDPIGGITRVEGKKNGAVFEAVLTGLRPGVTHTVQAYAVNANGLQGSVVSESRASPGYATAPSAPVMLAAGGQIGTKTIQFFFTPSTSPNIDYYEYQISSNSGSSWGSSVRVPGTPFEYLFATVGTTYGARVRAVDKFGNASSFSSGYFIGTAKWADGAVIVDSSINRGRSATTTGSVSTGTLTIGSRATIDLDVHCFFPAIATPTNQAAQTFAVLAAGSKSGAADKARFAIRNDDPTYDGAVDVDYRIFTT